MDKELIRTIQHVLSLAEVELRTIGELEMPHAHRESSTSVSGDIAMSLKNPLPGDYRKLVVNYVVRKTHLLQNIHIDISVIVWGPKMPLKKQDAVDVRGDVTRESMARILEKTKSAIAAMRHPAFRERLLAA